MCRLGVDICGVSLSGQNPQDLHERLASLASFRTLGFGRRALFEEVVDVSSLFHSLLSFPPTPSLGIRLLY